MHCTNTSAEFEFGGHSPRECASPQKNKCGVGLRRWENQRRLSTLCLKKVPTFKLSVTLSNLNRFSKPIQHYLPHLMRVATLPWEIQNSSFLQTFSKYERKCKHVAFLSTLALLFIHKFWYFRCLNSQSFPILLANKIFHVTVLLLNYFYNQFVALEIRHSRRHCSVRRQSTWYSTIRTTFW